MQQPDDSDYTGKLWTYGYRYRPPGYGHQPDCFITRTDREHPRFRYGTRDFTRKLTQDECETYELEYV